MSRHAMHSTLSLLALAVAAAACTRPAGPRALLDIPVTSSQERDPAEFNAQITHAAAGGLDWPGDPVAVARRFASRPNERLAAWTVEGQGEFPTELHVIGVVDGFSDDSVRGERIELWLEPIAGVWRIARARVSWRCWQDRGHETFGMEPCS